MKLSHNATAFPISQGAPAGVSDRYEPEYEQLQVEIASLVSPDATGVR
jgi:hypothetical protein